MAKPTVYPEWATGATGIAETVEPSAGKKADGWADAELPPNETFNWLANITHEWIKYLDLNGSARVKLVAAAELSAHNGDGSFAGPYWGSLTSGGGYNLYMPLPVETGQRITGVAISILEDDAEAIVANIFDLNIATQTPTAIGGTKTSGTSGGQDQLSWTDADADIPIDPAGVTSHNYYLVIGIPQTSSANEARVYGVTINYDLGA